MKIGKGKYGVIKSGEGGQKVIKGLSKSHHRINYIKYELPT